MILEEIISAQKQGLPRGIPSVCSAHPWVLTCVMQHAVKTGLPVLVESTCNQVNQFGGYTGMTPDGFYHYVLSTAGQNGLPPGQLIMGGDHLGPSVWQNEPSELAMQKAESLIESYIRAGYTKIHLDTSMKLGGDGPQNSLDPILAAQRTAHLASVAEATFANTRQGQEPVYVIGTEVPVPGGATEHEDKVTVTLASDVTATIEMTRNAFKEERISNAWERVIAVVVQPGVEFGDDFVIDYNSRNAKQLSRFIGQDKKLVFEAHSTDYQMRHSLRQLVKDHFAILKVGPALTYAFRKGVFALAEIESELFSGKNIDQRSNIGKVIDESMCQSPGYWANYYKGSVEAVNIARKFSLSDRIRYYWPVKEVQDALRILLNNLEQALIPLPLLDQFTPIQYERIRSHQLDNNARAIVSDMIFDVLRDYDYACYQSDRI